MTVTSDHWGYNNRIMEWMSRGIFIKADDYVACCMAVVVATAVLFILAVGELVIWRIRWM